MHSSLFHYSFFEPRIPLNITKSFLSYNFFWLLILKVVYLLLIIISFKSLRVQKFLRLNFVQLGNCTHFRPSSLHNHSSFHLLYILSISLGTFLIVTSIGVSVNHRKIDMILILSLRKSNETIQRRVFFYWVAMIEIYDLIVLTRVFLVQKWLVIFSKFFYNNWSFKEVYFGMNNFASFFRSYWKDLIESPFFSLLNQIL